jgi:hypothetical protein
MVVLAPLSHPVTLSMVSLAPLIMAGREISNLAGAPHYIWAHYFVQPGRYNLTLATLVGVDHNQALLKILWSFPPCDSCHLTIHMITVF